MYPMSKAVHLKIPIKGSYFKCAFRQKVQCERCDDQVGAGSALRAHIAAVHKGIRYKCDICGQTFRNKGAIKSSKHDKKSVIKYSTEDKREHIVFLKTRLLNFSIYDWEY